MSMMMMMMDVVEIHTPHTRFLSWAHGMRVGATYGVFPGSTDK
jgi:hypothetical protein